MGDPTELAGALEIRVGDAELGDLRDVADAWLEDSRVRAPVRRDVVLALSELVDNARRHGDSRPEVVVSFAPVDSDGTIELRVVNSGDVAGIAPVDEWVLPDPLATSGRGLAIVARVADSIDVEGDEETTIVRVRFGNGSGA